MIRRAFGNALRDVRELLNLSQLKLAEKGEFEQSQISKMERGYVDAGLRMQERLCRSLGIHYLTFQSEIAHHMAKLGIIEARDVEFWSRILVRDTLEIKAIGRIDMTRNARFIEQVFGMAKECGAEKILMDLSLALCHFSQEEQVQGTRHGLRWMQKNSFWPIVAVVANSTLNGLGVSLARQDGARVQLFSRRAEAGEWLKQQSPNRP